MREEFDLIVIGGGGGGLTAALTASRAGASVALLEAGDTLGGTYAYSSGLVWLPANRSAADAGIKDSLEEAGRHIMGLSGGRASEPHVRAYLENGNEVLAFLGENGVPLDWIPGYPDYYAEQPGGLTQGRYLSSPVFTPSESLPANWVSKVHESPYYRGIPFSWQEIQSLGGYASAGRFDQATLDERIRSGTYGFGAATTGFLTVAALKAGVDIRLGTHATALLTEGGTRAVRGVSTKSGDSSADIAARGGVVLATGGYDHSEEMQRRLDPHAEALPFGYRHVDGSMVSAALNIGAGFVNLGGQLLAPAYELGDSGRYNIAAREAAFPGGIVVNRHGERFADDSFYWELGKQMGAFQASSCAYENMPAFLIFDEEWRQTYRLGAVDIRDDLPDWVVQGRDESELAQALGLETNRLRSTIAEFNRSAISGEDPRFGRGQTAYSRNQGDSRMAVNPCVRALDPPLYGIRLTLGSMGTLSGLWTSENGQVLGNDGCPIPGLYACGNAMANLVEGNWYTSGTSNGRGLVFGRLAGLHAVK